MSVVCYCCCRSAGRRKSPPWVQLLSFDIPCRDIARGSQREAACEASWKSTTGGEDRASLSVNTLYYIILLLQQVCFDSTPPHAITAAKNLLIPSGLYLARYPLLYPLLSPPPPPSVPSFIPPLPLYPLLSPPLPLYALLSPPSSL